MSSSAQSAFGNPDSQNGSNEAIGQGQPARAAQHKNYKGFVAGVFSGIGKLTGKPIRLCMQKILLIAINSWPSVRSTQAPLESTHEYELTSIRFDTIKVRLQTSERTQFKGPLDCLLQTVRHEGVRGLYKGATPPLVGWMFMDSMYERNNILVYFS